MTNSIKSQAERRASEALWEGAMTRSIKIGAGALAATGECLDTCFPAGPVIVVADSNTYRVAGRQVVENLRQEGRQVIDPYIFEDDDLYGEYRFVERLHAFLAKTDAIPVAVGSGTINDLTKLAAHLCERTYMTVGTAASMDGYTAFGASITKDGYKQTFSCPAPLAVVIDLDVLADAPPEMNAAGYADLLAKIPAGADWILADAAGAEAIDVPSWKLVQDNLREWVNDPVGVRTGNRTALAGLAEGLILTGLGMQRANSSRPASGADHQFSHLWDMQHHTHQGETPMHGCKVAIGTLASAAMYDQVLSMSPKDIPTDEALLQSRWSQWEEIEKAIHAEFPEASLAEQVLVQSRGKFLDATALAKRLGGLQENWSDVVDRLRNQLIPTNQLQKMLADAGAPHVPEDIGISRERLHTSYQQAQRIRSRYTVLDITLEAGWWTPCVEQLFEIGGFWHEG